MSVYYSVDQNTTVVTVNTSAVSSTKYVVIPPNDPSVDLNVRARTIYFKETTGVPGVSQFNVNWITSSVVNQVTVSSLQCLSLLEYPADVYTPINFYGGTCNFNIMETPSNSTVVDLPTSKSITFVDLRTQSKTILLPSIASLATSSQSPFFTIKDIFGFASNSPMFLSTTSGASIDGLGESIGIRDNFAAIDILGDVSLNRWHILNYFVPPTNDSNYWFLVDSDLNIWTANLDFTRLTNTNSTLPVPSNNYTSLSGFQYSALWTGTRWLYYSQANKTILESFDGSNWNTRGDLVMGLGYGVIASDGLTKVGIWTFGGKLYLSSNRGDSFVLRTTPNNSLPDLLITGNKIFLTLWDATYLSTDDGLTWSNVYSADLRLSLIKYPGGDYIGCGRFTISRSSDGISWSNTPIVGPTFGLISDILYSSNYNIYLANAIYTNGPMWSTDAINWNSITITDGSFITSYDYVKFCMRSSGTTFAYRDQTNNQFFRSADGSNWEKWPHPEVGKKFIDGYPKFGNPDSNRNNK